MPLGEFQDPGLSLYSMTLTALGGSIDIEFRGFKFKSRGNLFLFQSIEIESLEGHEAK